LGGIALEWNEDLRPWLNRWIKHGVLTDLDWGDDFAVAVWGGDGRLTAGHLAALRRWADSGLLITLTDGTPAAPRHLEENTDQMTRQWTQRDAAMAARVLSAPYAPGGRLVVAGNLHTCLEPLPAGDPLGSQLARQRPGLCSIECVYGRGRVL
jgi:hypothetical protein